MERYVVDYLIYKTSGSWEFNSDCTINGKKTFQILNSNKKINHICILILYLLFKIDFYKIKVNNIYSYFSDIYVQIMSMYLSFNANITHFQAYSKTTITVTHR